MERVEFLSVEDGALHVDVLARGVAGTDGELVAASVSAAEVNFDFLESRTCNLIYRLHAASAVCLEQSDGRHYSPSAHLALVLVSEICIGLAASVISFENRTAPSLSVPWLSGPVEQIGEMHRLLVALDYRMVPILVVRSIVPECLVLVESPEKPLAKPVLGDVVHERRPVLRDGAV